MSVKKFTDAAGQPAHVRTAAVQRAATAKLISATKARSDVITQIDDRVSRLSAAFNSKKRQFTRAELGKVTASLKVMAREVNKEARASLEHMNTALRLNIATNKIVAQTEDLSALHGKISILHRVACASLAGDDGDDDMVQLDDSGYVVDGDDDNILDDLPTAPAPGTAPTAKKRKANDGVNNLSEEGLDGEPIGVPQEETVDEQTDPSDPGSRGAPKPTNMNLTEANRRKAALIRQAKALLRQAGELDADPVGVPDPYDAGGTQDSDDYGSDEPGTSAPSTTLSHRRKADDSDDSSDLPDFLQDDTSSRKSKAGVSNDGDPDYADAEPGTPEETVKVAQRRRRADQDGDFNPPNGEDLDTDTVSKRKAAKPGKRRADGTMPPAPPAAPADPDLAAGGTDPNDPSMDPTMADDGLDPAMDPSMDPTMADDGGDLDDLDPTTGGPTMADDGTDPDDLSDMGPTMADGEGDDLGLTPDDGMDQMLQAEILADGDFPLDGSDTDPSAPGPADLTSSARAARRMTAARSGRAAPANAAGDALKSMIESEFR